MLSKRQVECLLWVKGGKSSTDIGPILGMSPRTVADYIAAACAKLGVRTRAQAVAEAMRRALLRLSPWVDQTCAHRSDLT